MTQMKKRKADHIEICLNREILPDYRYWDDVTLIHDALPEVDLDDIDTSARVLGKKLDFPLIVTAITGGFEGAEKINANIAEACAKMGVGMGVGSERAAIEGIDTASYEIIKDYDVPLVIGNVGVPQLVPQRGKRAYTAADVAVARDLIDADYVAIHLNFLQEVVQPEGDTNAKGCYDAIRSIAREVPIIAKETGAGVSARTAAKLSAIGVAAIDIAGMGGTSFSAVEMHRARDREDAVRSELGMTYFDWGIPAPVSLLEANVGVPLISSGGIVSGLDVARSIAMGACCAGAAGLFLKAATESPESVIAILELIKEELKAAMLLTGSSDIEELSHADYILFGETRKWMEGLK